MEKIKKRNEAYITAFPEEFAKDKFYHQPGLARVVLVYFNPDSNAGGQLVYNFISYGLIKEAYLNDKYEFFDYLQSCCHQELVDIDSGDFFDAAVEFVEESCDYTDSDEKTMYALLCIAARDN